MIVIAVVSVGAAAGLAWPSRTLPLAGEYGGMSPQRLPVKLTVSADRKTLKLDVSWCQKPCAEVERRVRRSVKIDADGGFSWEEREGYVNSGYEESSHLRLEGHGSAEDTIVGTWRVDKTSISDDDGTTRVSTGDLHFSVRRGASVRQPAARADGPGKLVIPVDGSPRQVAVGEGRAWVLSESGTNRLRTLFVSEIDPRTGALGRRTEIKDRLGVAPSFTAMTASEGALWLTGGGMGTAVARVDAHTRRVRFIAQKPRVHADAAVGAGALWQVDVRPPRFNRLLLRSDPVSGRTVRRIRLSPRTPGPRCRHNLNGPSPQLIAVGGGSVWVISETDSFCGRLSRIDPRTNRVTRAIAPGHPYYALAAAPGGIWGVTRRGLRFEYGRPVQQRTELHRIGLRDGRPTAVTRLPEGDVLGLAVSREAVWISQANGDRRGGVRGGVVRRVDRATRRLSTALRLKLPPPKVAIGEGAVWVIDTSGRALTRLAL